MAQLNQDNVMTTLSYLRGERTVPTANVDGRKDFIQSTLEEVYQAYPWKFAARYAEVTVVSGIATLPTGLTLDHDMAVRYTSGTDEIALEQINVDDRHKAVKGDLVYWINSLGDDQYQLKSLETDITLIKLDYQIVPPTINASITTPYPDRLTLALGANRWVKASEDPQADISQDDILFKNQLAKNIAGENRNRAHTVRRTAQSETGSYTGEF